MEDISGENVAGKYVDDLFIKDISNFSMDFFKATYSEADNNLISPVSAVFSLAMTTNGAGGNTLAQMNQALSKNIPIDTLNQYLYSFRQSLRSTYKSKLDISNSIWFRDSLAVEKDFLQTLSSYYDVSVYQSSFNNQTLVDMNNWIKNSTNGRIKKGIDGIDELDMMYLINTLEFDAKWKEKYEKKDIDDSTFYNQDGSTSTVKFLSSTENYYFEDGKATGFIKPYYDDNYRFVALLPNEDISISEYVNQLTGESFINTLNNAYNSDVYVEIPEFNYECSLFLNDALVTLGMTDATSMKADFTGISKSQGDLLFLEKMIQKTYITVDREGTKAGAITIVLIGSKGDDGPDYSVILDRPFVYAIIDSKTNIPIFLGAVLDINKSNE